MTPSPADPPAPLPRILAVDDTPRNLQLLAEILTRKIECDLLFATDGPQALESAREVVPDLILLDVMMPGMTGFEVCAELKKNPVTESIPVIFLTAKVETDDMVAGFEYGAADYVVKPFNPAELIARVKTQLKIKESTDLIDRQNQELRQWIHILCHDLANPILGIQYLVELTNDPARFPEMTRHIREGAQSAMNIITLVRQLRALDEGKQQLDLKPVGLKAACRRACDILKDRLENKGISLVVEAPDGLNVLADETALVHSVLSNLITNAIKFSPSGSSIILQAAPAENGLVRAVIRDLGVGMPPVVLERLFDPLHQTSRPGTDGETGTGFGMPLVRKFMTLFGGRIEVQSRDIQAHPSDHGTEITLDFRSA